MITILGIDGSPRVGKSSGSALKVALSAAQACAPDHLTTHTIELGHLSLGLCRGCRGCEKKFDCALDDDFRRLLPQLAAPDVGGLIVATPVYFGSMSAHVKTFFDRSLVLRQNGFLWRNVVGAAISAGGARNGGQELAIQSVHAAMLCHDMLVVGDSAHYGATVWSRGADSVDIDKQGQSMAERVGRRVAQVALAQREARQSSARNRESP